MTLVDDFASAYASIRTGAAEPELAPIGLAKACVAVLPVAGAGISMFSGTDIRVPVGASDRDAAEAERLQFTADEGPCLDAHRTSCPVLATGPVLAIRWPDFHHRLVASTPFRSIFSFPLQGELSGVGSVDLYCRGASEAEDLDVDDVDAIAGLVTEKLLAADVFTEPATDPRWLEGPGAIGRHQVLIAMGMISVAQGLEADVALAELRRYASDNDQTVDLVAGAVVSRDLSIRDLQCDRAT